MVTCNIEAGIQKIANPGGRSSYVCGSSAAGIAGSSPAEVMDIYLFLFCVVLVASRRSELFYSVQVCVLVCVKLCVI